MMRPDGLGESTEDSKSQGRHDSHDVPLGPQRLRHDAAPREKDSRQKNACRRLNSGGRRVPAGVGDPLQRGKNEFRPA